jgi:hypothetical protein
MVDVARLLGHFLGATALLMSMATQAEADPAPASACASAIALVEPTSGLPPGLLLAIALVETGRAVPGVGGMQPWPWSWNAGGRGGVASTKAAAVAAVTGLRAGGVTSVDVGCMQINLLYHPAAFASLDEAFDPVANVRYAAAFLSRLRAGLPDWEAAIRRYHSGNATRGEAYQRRVAMAQLGQAWRGGAPAAASIDLPPRGICAPGARLVLVLRGTPDPRVRHRGPRMVCLAPRRR